MEIKIDIKITCPAIQASIVWTITLAFKYIQELKLYIFDERFNGSTNFQSYFMIYLCQV